MNAPIACARIWLTGFVVMPAVWDGLSAKLTAAAGFKTAFLSGSCVAASRLGGPDLDLLSCAEMLDSLDMVRGAAPRCWCWPTAITATAMP